MCFLNNGEYFLFSFNNITCSLHLEMMMVALELITDHDKVMEQL